MRKIFTILLILTSIRLQAQTENLNISFDGATGKDFGGFILDMGSMLNTENLTNLSLKHSASPLSLLSPELLIEKTTIKPFEFKPSIIYFTQQASGLTTSAPHFNAGNMTWQGASYKLKNGWRINTYGEYNADGKKVYNPMAMPWQRNNFNAAFEIKSENGSFGIKVEVQGGRNNPF